MQILFIYHSCFAVVTDTMVLVFDYWKDHPDGRLQHLLANRGDRQLFFVVSHFHEDHFNPDICNIDGAHLLVSYDTAKRRHVKGDNVDAILRPDDTFSNDFFTLHALRSTDVGISSLLSLPDGTTIYHAGDNNNWYFLDDDEAPAAGTDAAGDTQNTEAPADTENLDVAMQAKANTARTIHCSLKEMEGLFLAIVRAVRKLTPQVDHVMFPVDPRLGKETLRGVGQWLWNIKTANLYPMHCWERWTEVNSAIAKLRESFPEVNIHYPLP